jgi:hypothetical protein
MSILPIYLVLSSCVSSPIADTQKVTNQSEQLIINGYQVETIASSNIYPTAIQVIRVQNGLQIMGAVTHYNHQAKRIRGYVDVELVDTGDQIVKQFIIPLQHQFNRAKRGHSVPFSVLISDEVPNEYRIRIRHNISSGDHH